MRESIPTPLSLAELATLSRADLRKLHDEGTVPAVEDLRGRAAGLILPFSFLRVWKGKVFDTGTGTAGGVNRLGAGSIEFTRYRFDARVGQSAFGGRQVVLLDHDRPENPYWVRIFHDELVQIRSGFYLATSHLRLGRRLQFLGYFALQFSGPSPRPPINGPRWTTPARPCARP